MRCAGDIDRLQRLIAADAVIGMDNEIARRQVVNFGDELVEVAPAPSDPCQAVAEDVLLAEQYEFAGRKALLDRQYREPDRSERQFCESLAIGDPSRVGNTALAQHAEEPLGRALAKGGDGCLPAGFAFALEIIPHRLEQHNLRVRAFGGKVSRRPGAGVKLVAGTVG